MIRIRTSVMSGYRLNHLQRASTCRANEQLAPAMQYEGLSRVACQK
jgi:hypothetical protein